MYKLPDFNTSNIREKIQKFLQNKTLAGGVLLVAVVLGVAVYTGAVSLDYLKAEITAAILDVIEPTQVANTTAEVQQAEPDDYDSRLTYEQAIIDAVKEASPSVVSIIISKNVTIYEEELVNPFGFDIPGFNIQIPQQIEKGKELREVGSGSGFIVSSDGLVLTNKHVVLDDNAQYTVVTTDNKKYPAKILAKDPVQDLAVIKIQAEGEIFPAIKLGNSDGVQVGQGVIAIGNALGKFRVVSGLGRTISASDQVGSFTETLENIIQTDAAINQGNSGGPLLNLKGEVIGINTAMAQGAQTIGFAIPINIAKKDIDQVVATNKIVYPFLGVRYVLVDEQIKREYGLSIDRGAYLLKSDDGQAAVTPNSAAEKAGLKNGDIILEINGEVITQDNSMAKIIQKYNPGDAVKLKVLRGGGEIEVEVVLGER